MVAEMYFRKRVHKAVISKIRKTEDFTEKTRGGLACLKFMAVALVVSKMI